MEDNENDNDNNIISDLKLLKYFSQENLEEMATLFSNGSFSELLNKYFYSSVMRTESVSSALDRYSSAASSVEVNYQNNNQNHIYQSSVAQKTGDFNFNLFEKLNEDELCQQILLTIALYCLLKKKNIIPEEAKTLIDRYNYPQNDMIFPLVLLKAKFYMKTKDTSKAIDILNEAINSYEDYKLHLDEKKDDLKNIYTIETFHQNFKYFYNLFNYLFCMNRLDVKIKKLYFELKMCLYTLKFYNQAYKTILELYQKYPDDILIQYELAKDSVMFSKLDKFNEILEEMKKNRDNQKDQNNYNTYNNFVMYAEALKELAQCKYDESKNIFEEILKNDENNVLVKNNIAILTLYKNNPKECYDKIMNLYQDKKNESGNEFMRNTLKSIQEKFHVKSKQ
jgi:tetratricopeptide (TPR) repeat protein